ncbi:MAG TPA: S8 family serine peptidase [Thermoanaerobaculia bacterium]|jgi:subtilisin family serine protease|nr:S8 family serine peptidase [Thermoanaerobaculia bacterium]
MKSWPSLSGFRWGWTWIAAVVLALASPVYAVTAPEIRITPTTLYFGSATPSARAAGQNLESPAPASSRPVVRKELREKAASTGAARVIVQLAAPFSPEGRLAAGQALAQRQAIGSAQDAALEKLAGQKVKLHARYQHMPFLALEVDAAALDLLASLPEVTGIQEDRFEKPLLASSNVVIGSGVAWSKGLTGAGKVIAVLDTGVDKNHPYFSSGAHNKVVSEACYSSNIPGDYYSWTSLCPGGVAESTASGSGMNCSASINSDCQHGTHVAGIAAGNDGVGPNFGVARDADLISIQVFSAECYTSGGGCYLGAWLSDELKGLERVYALAGTYDIAAVNVSIGNDYSYSDRASCDTYNPALKAAIDNLRSIDIATVGAAGNGSGYYSFYPPACISSAISVGATDDDDQVASFSPVGPAVDLMAPGVSITSSVPGGGTATLNGTSMAAPHVAGAWAILRQEHPSASVSEILAILRATAVPVSGSGFSDMRRINLGKAVTAGPFVTQEFMINNDGTGVLSVLSAQLETQVSWIRWTPEAPFDVAPGGAKRVSVTVDFGAAPSGITMNRLIVGSTDADENPYPNAVNLVIGKETCYLLTRTRTGNGGLPDASPLSSSGCQPGEYRAGQSILLTAHPGIGWATQSWSGTDSDAGATVTKTLTMPAAPRTVAIAYYAPCFTLTLSHTGSGGDPVASPASSPGCAAGHYKYAESLQLTAVPTRGWRVGGWTHTIADASHRPVNSLTMPPNDQSVSVSYLEGVASLLLVGDSFNFSDYTPSLSALGLTYETWDTYSNGTPDAATLALYPRILWESNYSSLGTAQESALATYLSAGGGLFLSSPSGFYNVDSFVQDYLGIGGASSNYLDSATVTGRGSALSGLGPFNLYSYNYNVTLTPLAGTEVALQDSSGGIEGVSKIGASFRTLSVGSVYQSLYSFNDQTALLGAGLDFVGTVFVDITRGFWAKSWIESLYRNGVTSGCARNPLTYCPGGLVTRDQMAVFLLRSKEGGTYTPPPCTVKPFNDVEINSTFCPWIQELAARGITHGCGNGNYCPGNPVTRDQMAFFLLTALEGSSYTPPACTESFSDVSPSSTFCPYIQELAARGISNGCGNGRYCPGNPVSRDQMAKFLVTTFRLPIF